MLRHLGPDASFNCDQSLLKDKAIPRSPIVWRPEAARPHPEHAPSGLYLGLAGVIGPDVATPTPKDSRPQPESFHDTPVMALHIRDFRQSDVAGVSRLSKAACRLGEAPGPDAGFRILVGLRDHLLAGAVWFGLERETGIIRAVLVAQKDGWQSDVQELIAEASLWLTLRGAARIELEGVPQDTQLLARLEDMHFKADERTRLMHRLVPARSGA